MMMFALTAVASLSLSMTGGFIEQKFLSALLWVVIFFAASAGISGTFDDEAQAGTLPTLKLYADAQAILLSVDADIWLLDEPTANLDDDGREKFFSEIQDAKSDKIILLATNDKAEEKICDETIKLPLNN